jgi:pimeloyl-ACP methyl ester carboxylesterase
MQVYAHSYPEGVTGLVLLDPPPLVWILGEGFPELRELFDQERIALRAAAEAAGVSADAAFLNATASENEQLFGPTAERVAAIHSFGELPLTVIGATEPEPGFGEYAPAFRQFWNSESRTLAARSGSGQFILAAGSSHHIHLDAPQVVMGAILDMIR